MKKESRISFSTVWCWLSVALLVFLGIMALIKTGTLYRWAGTLYWRFAPPSTVISKVYGEPIAIKDQKMLAGYQNVIQTALYQNYEPYQAIDYMQEQTELFGEYRTEHCSKDLFTLINNKVIMHKAAEMELYPLSDADQSALSAMAHRIYKQFGDVCTHNGITEEYLLARLIEQKTAQLLMDKVTKNITAPEIDLRTAYDEQLAKEMRLFKENHSEYGVFLAGKGLTQMQKLNLLGCMHTPILMYRLDGYPMIQYLLIRFPSSIYTQYFHRAKVNYLYDESTNKVFLGLLDENFAKIKPLAQEVLLKAQAGSDFVELTDGYNGRCNFMEYQVDSALFIDVPDEVSIAARALDGPGSMTSLVGTKYGYYIIKLIQDIPGGPVPYEEVKEQINAALKQNERAEAWAAALAQWRTEANPEPSPGEISSAK